MFKAHQVLRTAVALTSAEGVAIPAATRVVVRGVSAVGVEVKVADATLPALAKTRLVASVGDFTQSKRGRPRKGA